MGEENNHKLVALMAQFTVLTAHLECDRLDSRGP